MTIPASQMAQQDERINEAIRTERKRLFDFIRQRVPSSEDAEDIMQDVLFQFVSTLRSMEPIEKTASWLFTVARNRITDFFRKKKTETFSSLEKSDFEGDEDESYSLIDDIMQDLAELPDAVYIRSLVWETLDAALAELPEEQRNIFIAHEMDGKNFNDLSEETGLSVNTLLSRKRYAVLHLRKRLQHLYNEFLNQ